jgi:predicted amino acid racemase
VFLEKLRERNPKLLDKALELHASGQIRPDTWVVDLDSLLSNASSILNEARKYHIELYYMTKQFGRNPVIAQKLQDLGYRGAAAVDYKEASVLLKKGLRLGHVGHFVQIPAADIPKVIAACPEIVTVYSYEKAEHISAEALKAGRVQPVMLRMWNEKNPVFLGQEAGHSLTQLHGLIWRLEGLKGIRVAGVTAFPCFIFNSDVQDAVPTKNVDLLIRSKEWLKQHLEDSSSLQVNMPSTTCVRTLPLIAEKGGTHAEPGHGLTGTTLLHAATDQPEVPAMVYVTEVSHHWKRSSMVYGGGFYRRGYLRSAFAAGKITMAYPLDPMMIDYHFEIDGQFPVGTPVLMAFRTQAFVTRSDIALVQGIHAKKSKCRLLGIFNSLGAKI